MKKTTFLAVLLPLFIASCSLFDKKKEAEQITEEVTPPSVWTSASELSNVENDFDDAYYDYRSSYTGGYDADIRNAFKMEVKTSAHEANAVIADKYHDWRVDNPDADGDTWLSVPTDEANYLYGYFEDYPNYFNDWRADYTMYGETVALDSLNSVSDIKTDATVDAVCQTFIENWRIAGENPGRYNEQFLIKTGILVEK